MNIRVPRTALVVFSAFIILASLGGGCGGNEEQTTSEPETSTEASTTWTSSATATQTSAASTPISTPSQFGSLLSSHDSLPPPGKMTKPSALTPFTDPVFNTQVERISDAKALSKPGLFPDYSKRQAWSSDESLLLLRSDDGSTLLFDGATYKFIKVLEGVAGEDLFWYPTDPALLLYNPGHELWAYNVKTDEQYRIFDFTGYEFANTRGEGNLSRDGASYAVVASTYNSSSGEVTPKKFILLSLTQAGGKITGKIEHSLDLPKLDSFDWVSVSPGGQYIVADYADEASGRFHGVEVYDRSFKPVWQKPLGAGHSDMTIDAGGDEALVMDVYNSDSDKTVFMKYRLSDGQATELLTVDAVFDQHISCRNENQVGWCIISTFDFVGRLTDSAATWLPFEDEIFALKLDGSGEVRRIAHHYSRRYSPGTPDPDHSVYWAEPHATVSRNGDRILFGSNWLTNMDKVDSVDAYVVDLR